MRIFVLRARAAPTSAQGLQPNIGRGSHVEVPAHTIAAALFTAKRTRNDVSFHLCMEGPPDPPKTVIIDSSGLTQGVGFHEAALVELISTALKGSAGLRRGDCREVCAGVSVCKTGFEPTVRALAARAALFVLEPRGTDIRRAELPRPPEDAAFVLTDHIPMPGKSGKLIKRLGAQPISLGPRMLFAAHSVVLVHNELDRREARWG